MRTSESGLKFIRDWEGCVLHVYKDPIGLPTIGVGHLIKNGEDFEGGITMERAMQLLSSDVLKCELEIDESVKVKISQHQFDALASWSFNCGVGVLRSSTLVRLLNLGNYNEVPHQLLLWCNAGGKRNEGLYKRRLAESQMWSTPDDTSPALPEVTAEDRCAVMSKVSASLADISRSIDTTPEPVDFDGWADPIDDPPTNPSTPIAIRNSSIPPKLS